MLEMKLPLTGIIPPMVTPLRDRDELDVAGLEKLIEHILSGGVSGLFILGTTGEGPSLSYRLRRELIGRVCKQVKDRVPVLVGITAVSYTHLDVYKRQQSEPGLSSNLAPACFFSGNKNVFA